MIFNLRSFALYHSISFPCGLLIQLAYEFFEKRSPNHVSSKSNLETRFQLFYRKYQIYISGCLNSKGIDNFKFNQWLEINFNLSSFSSKDGQVFEDNYVKMMGSRLVISFENENYNTHRWSLDIENARQLHKKILFVYNTKEGKMKDRRKFMKNEKRIYLDDGPNFDFYKIENILKFEYNLIEKNARANLFKIIQSKNFND